MGVEQAAVPATSAVRRRSRLSGALFRLPTWGDRFAEERSRNPDPPYARVRADGPVTCSPLDRQRSVSGHDEAVEVPRPGGLEGSVARG